MQYGAPGRDGHPPRALAIYLDNQLTALNLFTYTRTDARWAPVDMKTLHFASTGGVASITRHDLNGIADNRLATSESLSGPVAATQDFPDYCDQQIFTTPECEGYDEECEAERLAFYAASAAYVLAEAAYVAALAACAASGGTLCPSVVAAAGALTVAGLSLAAATVALEDCLGANGGGGGGTGGGGSSSNCETYIIEVSDDGGATWEYLATVTVCD